MENNALQTRAFGIGQKLKDWYLYLVFGKKSHIVNTYLNNNKISLMINLDFKYRVNVILGQVEKPKEVSNTLAEQILLESLTQKAINNLSNELINELHKSVPDFSLVQEIYNTLNKYRPNCLKPYEFFGTKFRVKMLALKPNYPNALYGYRTITLNFKYIQKEAARGMIMPVEEYLKEKNQKDLSFDCIMNPIMLEKTEKLLKDFPPRIFAELYYDYYFYSVTKPVDGLMSVEQLQFQNIKDFWDKNGSKIENLSFFENTKIRNNKKAYLFSIILPSLNQNRLHYNNDYTALFTSLNDEQEKRYLTKNKDLNLKEAVLKINIYRYIKAAGQYKNAHLTPPNHYLEKTDFNTQIAYLQSSSDMVLVFRLDPDESKLYPTSYGHTKYPQIIRMQNLNQEKIYNMQLRYMYHECKSFLINISATVSQVDYLYFPQLGITFFIPKQAFLWSYIEGYEFNPYQLEISTPKTQEEINKMIGSRSFDIKKVIYLRKIPPNVSNNYKQYSRSLCDEVIRQNKWEIEHDFTPAELHTIAFTMGRSFGAKALVCNIGLGAIVLKKILAHEAYTRENVGKHKYTRVYPGPLETIESFNQRMLTQINNNPESDSVRVEIIDDIHVFSQKTDQIIQVYYPGRLHAFINMGETLQSVWQNIVEM